MVLEGKHERRRRRPLIERRCRVGCRGLVGIESGWIPFELTVVGTAIARTTSVDGDGSVGV